MLSYSAVDISFFGLAVFFLAVLSIQLKYFLLGSCI